MSRILSFFKKRFDGVMILLLFFVLSLSLLFIYLLQIDANIRNYDNYQQSILKLNNQNEELDHVFMRSYHYVDNDKVMEITKQFDRELISLQKNKLTEKFGKNVIHILEEIISGYMIKTELIESFKTVNARITSSIHYLYELKGQIENNENSNLQIENLVSEILFKIGQVFLDVDLDVLNIERDLVSVDLYRNMNEEMDFFYLHTKQFLVDVKALKNILKQNDILRLNHTINKMNIILEKAYQDNQKKEAWIGLLFFIFAFLILLVLVSTYLNVLKNKREVMYLAYHDTLTGLPNRAEFERYITELMKHKNDAEKKFAVLFIDLDRFKVINDTLGHDIGDEMLITLSQRISKKLGRKNLLARIGGDEFVAIIENSEDLEMLDVIAAEIASIVRKPIQIREYNLNTTASIGIAIYPQDGEDKSMLLKHADSAMYYAKDNGRDTYEFYNQQLSVNIQRRLDLEQELVHGIERKEFTLCFQPQYHLTTGNITGVEALMRWNSKLLGQVSPEEFISVAEDTGLIVELGYFVFRTACKEYMKWKYQGVDVDLISINISSVQLSQADAFVNFKRIIEETGMSAKNIEIELTERYIMEYTTEKLTILDELRSLGCKISIDDFGTGYSSMSYLKSLAIDTIKIDKSFISGLPDNTHDCEVSKAIIVLSQSLGYRVIAEGIETIEQENLLKEYACDIGQGFYFAKPMDSKTFVDFFKRKKQ